MLRVCNVPGCEKITGNGHLQCSMHYWRKRKYNSYDLPKKPLKEKKSKKCDVLSCEKIAKANRKLCGMHALRYMRYKSYDLPCRISNTDKFKLKLKYNEDTGCLEWIGYRGKKGYGVIYVNGKSTRAHRYSWEMHNGSIPKNMCICHHCDNPACCEISHLFLGTHEENMKDMAKKGRAISPSKLSASSINKIKNKLEN